MANITGDGHFTSKLNQVLSAPPAGILEFFSALNIFLSITACLCNALILIALHKVSSIYPPTKLFFRCLAITDLGVGFLVQPLYATMIMSPLTYMNLNHFYYVSLACWALSLNLCGVSVTTSTAISVDRLLVLLLGLRYRHIVTCTCRRVRVVIIWLWIIGISVGLIWMWRGDIAVNVVSVLLTLSLVISIFCYTRIHRKLRHQQAHVQNHVPQGQANGGTIPLNIARYKKTVSSILWVQLALVACYDPWGILAVPSVNGIENEVAWIAVSTLVYLNSSLNPILYCWKIREVKQEVKDTIRQLNCFVSN